ncbi:choice-of-anchor A family protein [Paenibacillus sp. NPDC058174]|uniref:choice-of-anchor A family protein n=1 Tax=Paenibacillus sp. NPDC058174 TaxID=3346366 RepID=UPI0036DC7063
MACINFGAANAFNVFLFGDHTQVNAAAQGRVAVGGKASYRDYSVGTALPVSTTDAQLIIDGDINIIRGTNNGNTIAAPASIVTQYTMSNRNGVPAQPLIDERIDFEEVQSFLECSSAAWAALPVNGTAVSQFGGLVLTGQDPVLNVFTFDAGNIDGSGVSLAGANNVTIHIPNGSFALINLLGNNIGFGSYSITLPNGSDSVAPGSRILWNVPEAAAFFHHSLIITGSVLAPLAVVTAMGSGQLNGQLIALSYDGNTNSLMEASYPFMGCLPNLCGLPSLSVIKTAQGAAQFAGVPGTPFVYQVVLRNTGVVPLTNISINDSLLDVQQIVATLAPAEMYVCKFNAVIREGRAGEQYDNVVTVKSDQTAEQSASSRIVIESLPIDVSFVETVNKKTALPGEEVVFSYFLVNNGNAPLTDATVTDNSLRVSKTLGTVFSGELLSQTYRIPQNAKPGSVITSTGRLMAANLLFPGYLQASAAVLITENPAVSLSKRSSMEEALPGDVITYAIRISNDSIITAANNLQIIDGLLGLNKSIDTLPPDSAVTYTQLYKVPAEAPAGNTIDNTATLRSAYGVEQASNTVRIGSSPGLLIAKDVDKEFASPGDLIKYTITLINTGNTVLTDITLTDSLVGLSQTVPPIQIGEKAVVTAIYFIPRDTPTDTIISNTVVAQSPTLGTITDDASVIVTTVSLPQPQPGSELEPEPQPGLEPGRVPAEAMLSVTGFANRSLAAPNESIVFTAILTNISGVTIRNIQLKSPLFQYNGLLQQLPPGQSYRLEGVFAVLPDTPPGTVIKGSLTVNSTQTEEMTVSANVVVLASPNVSLELFVAPTEVIQGEAVNYVVRIRNTGNVDLTNVFIRDSLLLRSVRLNRFVEGSDLRGNVRVVVRAAPGSVVTDRVKLTSDQLNLDSSVAAYTVFGLAVQLSANRSAAMAGDTIVFSVTVTNPSLTEATGITLLELLPPLTSALPGSLTRNGVPLPANNFSAGVPLGELAPGNSIVLTYGVILKAETSNGLLPAQVSATFFFPSTSRQLRGVSDSNQLVLTIEEEEE